MHGRATPEAGDAWDNPKLIKNYTAEEILRPVSYRSSFGKGWRELRTKFLSATPGTQVTSGGNPGSCFCGAGGGGFEGGFASKWDTYSPGGGGGSFCNATEGVKCSAEAGGNGRPDGYVIVERRLCF